MTGGSDQQYREVLTLFCRDADDRLERLREAPDTDGVQLFTTQVHALKSVLASIGAGVLSGEAAGLEDAGKRGDLPLIRQGLDGFRENLAALVANLRAALLPEPATVGAAVRETPAGDKAALLRLKAALEAENIGEIDGILDALMNAPGGAEIKAALDRVADYVLLSEFQAAVHLLENTLEEER
jgi:HPt (histidine-containing phosphotransfer) domain-containing protein